MSKIKTVIWKMQPHTEMKHIILKKYLDAWLPIMANTNKKILYIDGFAGPGEYKNGEIGSPIIAINAIKNHKANITSEIRMFFFEADKDRCDFLDQKISKMSPLPSNIKIKIEHARFGEKLKDIFDSLDGQKQKIAPAFVFVDPFGFPLSFKLVKRIMENKGCEVLITFMYEEINRFLKKPELSKNFDKIFGTNQWRAVLSIKDPGKRKSMLHEVYKNQLEKNANIEFVRSFEMKNKSNKTDYFLFFGTNNIVGLKKMKEAMWKVDGYGNFQFSDATHNPLQPMLFEKEPRYHLLKKIILEKFRGKIVTIRDLEYFILTKTYFRETHYKTQILGVMEKANPPKIIRKCDKCAKSSKCKIIRTRYPEDCCQIKFL